MSETKEPRAQPRDRYTGKFAYDGDFERMCRCGHKLGVHVHGGFDCLAGTGCLDDPNPPGQGCDCMKFRPLRKRGHQ